MYIHGIYSDIYIFKEYSLYIPCIYMVYTLYLQWHLQWFYIFKEYFIYIPCIYNACTWIYMVYHVLLMLHLAADVAEEERVPFHWLHQQWAIITLIFLHSWVHWRYLLLAKWMRRARLELKIALKCSAWQARHTNRASSPSVIPVSEVVPKTTTIKQIASRCGCWESQTSMSFQTQRGETVTNFMKQCCTTTCIMMLIDVWLIINSMMS